MARITKLLVANRGEIACRIIRTAHEMGIQTVAVYAEPDARAPFVRDAGEAIALCGTTSAETYLDTEKVLAAAKRTGADAIHPGYGFLSENADFATAVTNAGLIWVGPNPAAIAAMGDKLEAKKLMSEAGVPILRSIEVNGEVDDALIAEADKLGYPLLVKAAGGGGGKGMRIVAEGAKLKNAVNAAKREARGAFGNDTVFIERYLERTRHVELQIFGDKHGNVVHLFERECSIQRRHQKIIEEAPSSAVSPELRERMGSEAVAAGRALGYDNAGTVEFLLDDRGHFYFLEVNTRLQVEHPVTEAITGRDLVREQIRVAEGDELSFAQSDLHMNGHAIQARLYAEDPAKEFFPAAGKVRAWLPALEPEVRIDTGVDSGSEISVYFDPMLAKIIAHAPTRTEASLKLALALERLGIPGLVSNRDFLVNALRSETFLDGDTTTDFIQRIAPPRVKDVPLEAKRLAAIAAVLAEQVWRGSLMEILGDDEEIDLADDAPATFTLLGEEFTVDCKPAEDNAFDVHVNGEAISARVLDFDDELIDLEVDGLQRTVRVLQDEHLWFTHDGTYELTLAGPEPEAEA